MDVKDYLYGRSEKKGEEGNKELHVGLKVRTRKQIEAHLF